MIAFRGSQGSRTAALALLLAVPLLATDSVAQTGQGQVGAPIPLRPGVKAVKPPPPSSAPGTADGIRGDTRILRRTRPPTGAEADSPVRRSGKVEIRRLEAFDPSSIGLLSEADGGFGLEMWTGSRASLVRRLLPRLPMGTTSPIMQSLAKRLLLSTARPPEPGKTRPEGPAEPSLLALRVGRLAAGGHLHEINDLLAQTASISTETALIETRMNANWLDGDEAGACSLARNMVEQSDDPVWQKSAALCHAVEGDSDRVELLEQLLAEARHEDDTFFAAIGALLGRETKPPKTLAAPTPLHVAMLRRVGWPLPEAALAGAGPLVLRSLVASQSLPPATRLEAAERAVSTGGLPVDDLREIYRQVDFSAEERQAYKAPAERQPGARSNALLYQMARAADQPIARAEALALSLEGARQSGRYATVARANAAALKSIAPVPGLLWFASEAGRALLAAGDSERAMTWLIMASRDRSEAGKEASSALWPLLLVADPRGRVPFDAKRFRDWWTAQEETPEADLARRGGLMLTLLEALGQRVPSGAWEILYDEADHTAEVTPSAVLIQGLGKASAAARKGETVLLALLALGPGGPARAAPATLRQVISALRRQGLEAEARAVALEAMLAREF
ncbi:MAG: hypothetical protein QF893_12815 [Alphaproteobacteria bacterium]|jgi:hypothetical protein|nr:hypothetical protein [Alphaproteobacteria bacterium]